MGLARLALACRLLAAFSLFYLDLAPVADSSDEPSQADRWDRGAPEHKGSLLRVLRYKLTQQASVHEQRLLSSRQHGQNLVLRGWS